MRCPSPSSLWCYQGRPGRELGLSPLINTNKATPTSGHHTRAGIPTPCQALMRSCSLSGCQQSPSGETRFLPPPGSKNAVLPYFSYGAMSETKSTKIEGLNKIQNISEKEKKISCFNPKLPVIPRTWRISNRL